MKQIVLQYLRKNRGVGRRRKANKRNIAWAKNIQSSSYAFNNKDGTAKVTIDLNFTPSQEVQQIELSTIFSDAEFTRLKSIYRYYKIDIVNCMFFSNTANGQVYVNYTRPTDDLVSIDNDFSRVVSYPMYKIKNVHFNQIKFRTSGIHGIFSFNGWNSTDITPNLIGEIIIYNKQQISINMKLRCVVRFRGYQGESIVTKSQIVKLQPDKLFVNAEVQTDSVELEPKVEKEKNNNSLGLMLKKQAKEELEIRKQSDMYFESEIKKLQDMINHFNESVKFHLDDVFIKERDYDNSYIIDEYNEVLKEASEFHNFLLYKSDSQDLDYQKQQYEDLMKKMKKYDFSSLRCKILNNDKAKPFKLKEFIK